MAIHFSKAKVQQILGIKKYSEDFFYSKCFHIFAWIKLRNIIMGEVKVTCSECGTVIKMTEGKSSDGDYLITKCSCGITVGKKK
jgi:hypothetical protein